MSTRFFRTAAEWRAWLARNHAREKDLLLGFYKKGSGRAGITYAQALDEALCFGWIDGVRRSLDAESYTIRFSPRRPRSIWSQVNQRHMARLIAARRVQPPGRAAYDARDEKRMKVYAFEREAAELAPAHRREFRANRKAWAFWSAQPPGYRKTLTWFVMGARKEETRQRRLEALIAACARGERLGLLNPPRTKKK
jgi:uncharacterized protein YdeI (YjbR/CyaY-like superfamily)